MSGTNGAIVAYETDHGRVELTADIVRRQLVNGEGTVTDQEVGMFLQLCKYQQLNPFLREAYLIKYGSQPASIVTGKDVFVKRAAKNEQFDGLESGLYLREEGGELTRRTGAMWLPGEKIVGAWAIVHRKDWTHPVESSVSFAEYVGKRQDGSVNKQWAKMPGTMIIKVAESHALRKAFPADFQGLYDAAEMSNIESDERVVTPTPDLTKPLKDARERYAKELSLPL
jgi:phage recombination protein Bet